MNAYTILHELLTEEYHVYIPVNSSMAEDKARELLAIPENVPPRLQNQIHVVSVTQRLSEGTHTIDWSELFKSLPVNPYRPKD